MLTPRSFFFFAHPMRATPANSNNPTSPDQRLLDPLSPEVLTRPEPIRPKCPQDERSARRSTTSPGHPSSRTWTTGREERSTPCTIRKTQLAPGMIRANPSDHEHRRNRTRHAPTPALHRPCAYVSAAQSSRQPTTRPVTTPGQPMPQLTGLSCRLLRSACALQAWRGSLTAFLLPPCLNAGRKQKSVL